jgi:hypothetical protein
VELATNHTTKNLSSLHIHHHQMNDRDVTLELGQIFSDCPSLRRLSLSTEVDSEIQFILTSDPHHTTMDKLCERERIPSSFSLSTATIHPSTWLYLASAQAVLEEVVIDMRQEYDWPSDNGFSDKLSFPALKKLRLVAPCDQLWDLFDIFAKAPLVDVELVMHRPQRCGEPGSKWWRDPPSTLRRLSRSYTGPLSATHDSAYTAELPRLLDRLCDTICSRGDDITVTIQLPAPATIWDDEGGAHLEPEKLARCRSRELDKVMAGLVNSYKRLQLDEDEAGKDNFLRMLKPAIGYMQFQND